MRIAVIGSGISGLASGFLLRNHAEYYLFESAGRIGGHSNTVDAHFGDVSIPVDTGFIVYNPLNYPNLMSLFTILSVPHLRTDMSFSVSLLVKASLSMRVPFKGFGATCKSLEKAVLVIAC